MQQLYTLSLILEVFVLTSGSLDRHLLLAAACNLQSKHDSSLPLLLSSSQGFTYISNDVRCITQVLFKHRPFGMRLRGSGAETPRASDTLLRALRYISLDCDTLWMCLFAPSKSLCSYTHPILLHFFFFYWSFYVFSCQFWPQKAIRKTLLYAHSYKARFCTVPNRYKHSASIRHIDFSHFGDIQACHPDLGTA